MYSVSLRMLHEVQEKSRLVYLDPVAAPSIQEAVSSLLICFILFSLFNSIPSCFPDRAQSTHYIFNAIVLVIVGVVVSSCSFFPSDWVPLLERSDLIVLDRGVSVPSSLLMIVTDVYGRERQITHVG